MIRRFSATWVYTLTSSPLKNGIVSVDENGVIVDITDTNGQLKELERLEYHSGIIVPGFINVHHWKPIGKNSLESFLPLIAENKKLLLIHNTYSNASDISTLRKFRRTDNVFMVLCPNSNLFIENSLPPVEMLRAEGLKICIGTDSLASNHQLSILSEMVILQHHFPNIELAELLTWACLNGAKALEMNHKLGTLEVGKKPGLLLIKGVDLKNHKLKPNSRIQRLV